jgi:hypothetical protein
MGQVNLAGVKGKDPDAFQLVVQGLASQTGLASCLREIPVTSLEESSKELFVEIVDYLFTCGGIVESSQAYPAFYRVPVRFLA